MRKLKAVAGMAALGWAARTLMRRRSGAGAPSAADVEPHRVVEEAERAADIPGGIRP